MHRSLHSLADILLLGRESGQGGPNLREGGGPIRLESAFRQLLVQKRHQHFQQHHTCLLGSPCQCTQRTVTCYSSPHQRTRIGTRGNGERSTWGDPSSAAGWVAPAMPGSTWPTT